MRRIASPAARLNRTGGEQPFPEEHFEELRRPPPASGYRLRLGDRRGSVGRWLGPESMVENKGDVRVLFLEGEQLIGPKQNRILNTSVLITAKSKVKIPVRCVEQGRWRYRSNHFGSSGSHSPSKLRYFLKASVRHALKEKMGDLSDQGKVWEEVERQQKALGASSGTRAMSDTFDTYKEKVADFQEKLRYVDGASGIAVAIGKKIVAVDVFDKAPTCKKVWDRLMSGYALDALEPQADEGQAEAIDVEQLLGTATGLPWEKAEPVGEGEECRRLIETAVVGNEPAVAVLKE